MDNGEPNYYNYKAKTNMSLYLNHEIENYTNGKFGLALFLTGSLAIKR